jgi:3-isopropylmalate dehydratase small subunit
MAAESSMNAPAPSALTILRGPAQLLGENINTDVHCSSKYLPGKDNATIAKVAFDQLVPGFAGRFPAGGIIVAGRNFGMNSSREQAIQILKLMGVAAIVSTAFGRQFFRNAINNGLPVAECDIAGIEAGDVIEVDLAAGRVTVPARGIVQTLSPMPDAVRSLLAAGGLLPYLKQHPDWK